MWADWWSVKAWRVWQSAARSCMSENRLTAARSSSWWGAEVKSDWPVLNVTESYPVTFEVSFWRVSSFQIVVSLVFRGYMRDISHRFVEHSIWSVKIKGPILHFLCLLHFWEMCVKTQHIVQEFRPLWSHKGHSYLSGTSPRLLTTPAGRCWLCPLKLPRLCPFQTCGRSKKALS